MLAEYHAFFDYVGGFFWSVAYILIAITAFINKKDKRLPMPITCLTLNISWEIASVIISHFEGFIHGRANFVRISWFVLDVFIAWAFYVKLKLNPSIKKSFHAFAILTVILTAFYVVLFEYTNAGMVLSSFVIDIIMAVLFFVYRKRYDPGNRVIIAIIKMAGDICALLAYSSMHELVIYIALGSFIFNLLYLIFALKELKQKPELQDDFKNNFKEFLSSLKVRRSDSIQHHKKRKKKKTKKTHRVKH